MGILTNERKILREIYLRADEALEFLNAELNKEGEAWISETASIYDEYNEQPMAIEAIRRHIQTKPMDMLSNLTIANAVAVILYDMHDIGRRFHALNNIAEEAIREVRHATKARNHAEGSGDDRQQGSRRPLRVSEAVHGQPGDADREP